MLDPATVAGHPEVTSGTLCTAIIDAQAARRRSLQTAFKQCLRTAEQHRAFLYLSAAADVHGGPADGSPLHIPLTDFSRVCSFARWVDGRQHDTENPLCRVQKVFVATLTNIDRLASADHAPFTVMSPVKPRTPAPRGETIIAGTASPPAMCHIMLQCRRARVLRS